MRQNKLFFLASFIVIMNLSATPALAAVGCDLNDPDKDVKRLFPGSTGYKTTTVEIQKSGGQKLLAKIEAKLRDKLHGLYEAVDTPYTVYQIYAKDKKIGYIHGVNQKGRYGGIQIFLILDLDQRIRGFYIQKITGQYGEKFRDAKFGKQFTGLALEDFERYDVLSGKGTSKVAELKNPVTGPEAVHDFRRILRGTKKNLILLNEFIAMSPELAAKQ